MNHEAWKIVSRGKVHSDTCKTYWSQGRSLTCGSRCLCSIGLPWSETTWSLQIDARSLRKSCVPKIQTHIGRHGLFLQSGRGHPSLQLQTTMVVEFIRIHITYRLGVPETITLIMATPSRVRHCKTICQTSDKRKFLLTILLTCNWVNRDVQ